MAFWWIYGSKFWLKVNKCKFTVSSQFWVRSVVLSEPTEATVWPRKTWAVQVCIIRWLFGVPSAEPLRKSCLSLLTRFLSKCVWLNVAGILVMHLPLWITRKPKTGGWTITRLGHSRSHLTVIRGSLNLAPAPHSHPFLHHKVSLSAGTESDFIAANSWQRRNKARKMDLILEFCFIFGLPLHAPLHTALEKQMVISESGTICHMRRGCSRWKSGRLHLKC